MFYNKLVTLCEENGVTMQKLESDCGLGAGLTTRWKNGFAKPSLASLLKISRYFKCDVHELVDAVLAEDTNTGK